MYVPWSPLNWSYRTVESLNVCAVLKSKQRPLEEQPVLWSAELLLQSLFFIKVEEEEEEEEEAPSPGSKRQKDEDNLGG